MQGTHLDGSVQCELFFFVACANAKLVHPRPHAKVVHDMISKLCPASKNRFGEALAGINGCLCRWCVRGRGGGGGQEMCLHAISGKKVLLGRLKLHLCAECNVEIYRNLPRTSTSSFCKEHKDATNNHP